ncbi:TolC family outer membrane protein [Solimonas marina]|uniref:TolC family outer membrane protein n=1 Tax=Solimonas marina TaxID=2714601 RepID=A0A969WFY5_9GAMM|nr:TolC family outer membrane protein [Solimonas marina]NKF24000.1 TolC family outer membrane protein [Solimonas marina]
MATKVKEDTTMRMAVWGLAISLLGVGGAARANSLLDAYHAAQRSDAVLESAAAARDAAIEAQPQARSLLLPQVTANASITRERYVLDGSSSSVSDPTDPTPVSDTTHLSGTDKTVSLDLTQPLWSVESFQKLRQASLQAAEAEAQYRDAEQSLILRVAEAYFAVLSAADNLQANRLERASYGALVDQAQKKLQTGLGARIGVEEAQAFHSLTEQSVSDAELTLFDAQRALQQITGRDLPITPLRDEIPLVSPQPANADDWLAAARDQNYAVQAAQLAVQAAKRGVSVVRGRYWPTISLQGSVGKTLLPTDLGGNQRVDSIGVVAQWPIFQGGLVRSQSREAQAQFREAQADYTAQLRQTERDTLAAYRGVLSGIHTIHAAQLAVQANQTAIDASKNGVEAGTRTEFDLLNAQNNYYSALRAYYQSRYDYLTNSLKLKAQAGRLTEADLDAVDAVLAADGKTVAMPAEPAP